MHALKHTLPHMRACTQTHPALTACPPEQVHAHGGARDDGEPGDAGQVQVGIPLLLPPAEAQVHQRVQWVQNLGQLYVPAGHGQLEGQLAQGVWLAARVRQLTRVNAGHLEGKGRVQARVQGSGCAAGSAGPTAHPC